MKFNRFFAVVALSATLTTNHVHSASSTALAVGAMMLTLPFAQAFSLYKFLQNSLSSDSNDVLEICTKLQEHEFAFELLPQDAKDLCALKFDQKTNHEGIVQAYEQAYGKGERLRKTMTFREDQREAFQEDAYLKAVNQLNDQLSIKSFFPVKNEEQKECTSTKSNNQEALSKFYKLIDTEISRIEKGEKNPEIAEEKSAAFAKWVIDKHELSSYDSRYQECKHTLSVDRHRNKNQAMMVCGEFFKTTILDRHKKCMEMVCPDLGMICPESIWLPLSDDCKRLAKTCKDGKVDLPHEEDENCIRL
ncbi:hypothetical protein K2X40_03450 [Candidatus Babeliales bacterium]|nr:hypothetical protein [Candidatus Babeliales bacterium]